MLNHLLLISMFHVLSNHILLGDVLLQWSFITVVIPYSVPSCYFLRVCSRDLCVGIYVSQDRNNYLGLLLILFMFWSGT